MSYFVFDGIINLTDKSEFKRVTNLQNLKTVGERNENNNITCEKDDAWGHYFS